MNGILPLYKPKGWTSHDCVMKVRKILKTKKVGHTGTLDPDVEGVLPICIGRATKIVQYLTNSTDKVYEGQVTLGIATTTEDASGEVIETKEVTKAFDVGTIEKVAQTFIGQIEQIPPMYSAVKVNGRKLYEYAREGKIVERPIRKIEIFSLNIHEVGNIINHTQAFRFTVKCSKGTYVRTLGVDLGLALGYPAHLSELTRTATGNFTIEDCLTLDDIEERVTKGTLQLRSIEDALYFMKTYVVTSEEEIKVLNGASLPLTKEFEKETHFLVVDQSGAALAIYMPHPTKLGIAKPDKILKI